MDNLPARPDQTDEILEAAQAPSIGDGREGARANSRSDNVLFFQSWISDPFRVAAFKPSGIHLAKAMAAKVDASLQGPVVELGPGTGAITRALVAHGVNPARLILIEADPQFCQLLRERWPEARVVQADAYTTPKLLRRLEKRAAAVVSGLPLLMRPPRARLQFVRDCLDQAVANAPFIQFTYFIRSPVPADQPALYGEASSMIWRNALPARVWSYKLDDPKSEEVMAYAV